MKPEISNYMREMQRRSAESRWGGLSAAERSAKMKAIRAKTKRKLDKVGASPDKCHINA
jgi:hypothetical protein